MPRANYTKKTKVGTDYTTKFNNIPSKRLAFWLSEIFLTYIVVLFNYPFLSNETSFTNIYSSNIIIYVLRLRATAKFLFLLIITTLVAFMVNGTN